MRQSVGFWPAESVGGRPAGDEAAGNKGDDKAPEYAFDEPPTLVRYVPPAYPAEARAAGYEGTVLIRVTVGTKGKVTGAKVIQSDVTPAMDEAAIDAAKQFLFKPAKLNGEPVEASMAVPIRFKLHGSGNAKE